MTYPFGGLSLANVGDIVTMSSVSTNLQTVLINSAGATAPTLAVGDSYRQGQTWYDTSVLKMKQWDGTQWVTIAGSSGGAVTGSGVPTGATTGATTLGAMYINTATTPYTLYTSNGASVWTLTGDGNGATVSGTAPTSPYTGEIWYESVVDGRGYVWDGVQWVDIAPAAGAAVATVGTGAPSGTTPGATIVGALYVDNTASPYSLYVSNGASVWTLAGDGTSSITMTPLAETSTTPTLSTRNYTFVTPGTIVIANAIVPSSQKWTAGFSLTDTTVGSLSFTDWAGDTSSISFSGCSSMTSLTLPVLTTSSGRLNVQSCPAMTIISAPSLTSASSINIDTAMTSLGTINLPALVTVGAGLSSSSLKIGNVPALTTVTLSSLTTVTGIAIDSGTSLTTVSLPALVTVNSSVLYGAINFTGCTVLSAFTLPATLKTVGGTVTVTGSALSQASVDNILIRLASLDGTGGTTAFSSKVVNLSGGTSSTPSAAGLTAKATLVARGCTVTTN